MKSNTEVQDKIRETGEFYFNLAEELFGQTIRRPAYHFDIRGTTGGQACLRANKMRFNMHIAHTHFDKYMASTVPHEVAHMVEFALYGTSGHARVWKNIMRRFGCNPSRCHSYDQLKTASGKDRPKVKCGCGEREIGPIKYKRLVSGESSYICGKCRLPVRPLEGAVMPSMATRTPQTPSPIRRRSNKMPAACGCGTTLMGPTQYKRMMDGAKYRCRKCRQTVRPV
jgi:SprT protein